MSAYFSIGKNSVRDKVTQLEVLKERVLDLLLARGHSKILPY